MNVYVGRFTYAYGGDIEVVVATTAERIEQELIRIAKGYLEYAELPEEFGEPETYEDFKDIGWEYEWFFLDYAHHPVLSDEHILRHVLEVV